MKNSEHKSLEDVFGPVVASYSRAQAIEDGVLIGTTAFFRNRAFLEALGEEIAELDCGGRPVSIMSHACSVGAEPWSLAIHLLSSHPGLDFQIVASDLSPKFIAFAKQGLYPNGADRGMTDAERRFLELHPDGGFNIGPEARQRVTFTQPTSFVHLIPSMQFDVVTLCNALVYVPAEAQARAIQRISGYNRAIFAVTGGHRETIAEDLEAAGYDPVMRQFERVHAGWVDRHGDEALRKAMPLPANIFEDPFLDPIDDRPGRRYRHGAIFRKQAAA